MKDISISFGIAFLIGAFLGYVKLPVPAPSTVAGIVGLIGLFIGWFIFK